MNAPATQTTEFTSRRTLVLRRFLRRRSAVASLLALLLLFVGCYALPSLLPYSYGDLDFDALLQPPNTRHSVSSQHLDVYKRQQVLEADIVYVRDLAHPELITSEQLSHLAMIAFHIYGSVDLAVYCIIELRQRGRVAEDAVEQLMRLFD